MSHFPCEAPGFSHGQNYETIHLVKIEDVGLEPSHCCPIIVWFIQATKGRFLMSVNNVLCLSDLCNFCNTCYTRNVEEFLFAKAFSSIKKRKDFCCSTTLDISAVSASLIWKAEVLLLLDCNREMVHLITSQIYSLNRLALIQTLLTSWLNIHGISKVNIFFEQRLFCWPILLLCSASNKANILMLV